MIRPRPRWFGVKSRPCRNLAAARRRRSMCCVEGLEDRVLLTGSPTVYVVDLTSDTGASTGALAGDILYCITQANANTNTAGSEIEFDPSVFSAATPQTIVLTSTLNLSETAGPELVDSPGASIVTVSGNDAIEVFSVASGVTATLSNLTISNGSSFGPSYAEGGGIASAGTLTVANCILASNTSGFVGGGITNSGTLTVDASEFYENIVSLAADGGGGEGAAIASAGGIVAVNSCIFVDNTAAQGGVVYDIEGNLTVRYSTFSGNGANGIDDYEGTLTVDHSTIDGFGDRSIGIFNFGGAVTIADTTFSHNSASGIVNEDGTMTISGSTVSDNTSTFPCGGGIYNESDSTLAISDSTISQNTADEGGGIYNDQDSAATICDSTISDNTAGQGGGIFNEGTLAITGSTVSNNSAGGFSGSGGGILSGGATTLINSTVADNSSSDGGCGILETGGTLSAVNCTIAYNVVPYPYGSSIPDGLGLRVQSATVTLDNTIIALNTYTEYGGTGSQDNFFVDASSTLAAASANNLIGPSFANSTLANGVDGNQVGVVNPGLSVLGNNGGPTQTIALMPGSRAIDAGSNVLAVDASGSVLATDQRGTGFPRVAGNSVDIGAFELETPTTNPAPVLSAITPDQVFAGGCCLPLTLTGSNFLPGSFVEWNGTEIATSDLSSTEIEVTVPPNDVASSGTATLTVINASPGGGSAALPFQVLPAPTLTAMLPSEIAVGSTSPLTLTFMGTNLPPGSVIVWNIAELPTTYVSPTELTATVPSSDLASIGTAVITLLSPTSGYWSFGEQFNILPRPTTVYVDDQYEADAPGTAVTGADGSTHDVGYDAFGTIPAAVAAVAPNGTVDIVTRNGATYVAAPDSADNGLAISGDLSGTIPGSDSIVISGDGDFQLQGESGDVSDVFTITDSAVAFGSPGALAGTTIEFDGPGLTRNVDAMGTSNTFDIEGAGVSGPSGLISGDAGHTNFVFVGTGRLLGSLVVSSGTGTLDYSAYSEGVTVNLGSPGPSPDGTATGVSGIVGGAITAIIGSDYNDTLNAGSYPGVALSGGPGTNSLVGMAGDSVVESVSSSYTLTDAQLTGSGPSVTDNLIGIRTAQLTGAPARPIPST